VFELLFAGLAVAQRLLQLTDCNFKETHANQVVRRNLAYSICFFNEFVAGLGVELALFCVWLDFN
jgi:hypothetical protein